MLRPLIKRPGRSTPHRTRERGVTMALVALSMVAIIAFAALAIDLGSLYEAKAEAQRSADAAALAAARVISESGLTGDPTNADGNWALICGTAGIATYAAQTVANQNFVGGAAPSSVKVYYGTSAGVGVNTDCSAAGTGFGINPVVSVYVQQATLPTFFAHVFSLVGGTGANSGVSATAYAEAFNPSDSNNGAPIPVQPRCVKPIIIPNLDPQHPSSTCSGQGCATFITPSSGQITSPGMWASSVNGVIGERFYLLPDCTNLPTGRCTLASGTNPPGVQLIPTHALQYVPGDASAVTPIAIPTSGGTCASLDNSWTQDVAGCDQSTVYQCGVQQGNVVNLTENPTNDALNAMQCLINQGVANNNLASGQDTLGTYAKGTPPTYPFQIQAGSSNPLVLEAGLASGSQITSSSSIASLPIYDQTQLPGLNATGTSNVTIIGFLQVFVNAIDTTYGIDVTVLNVSGCGNAASNTTPAAHGTSSVPIRLISAP
jgi:Putative Flp pilus-assembly TadE/G-like